MRLTEKSHVLQCAVNVPCFSSNHFGKIALATQLRMLYLDLAQYAIDYNVKKHDEIPTLRKPRYQLHTPR